MAEQLPPDCPVSSGNTFLLWSKLQRASSVGPVIVPSGIPATVVPSLSCQTGFSSVSGELTSAEVTITPQLLGGQISFEIMGYKQLAEGRYSFNLTVKTNGSEQYAPVTMTFTFEVMLFGRAHPYPGTSFLHFMMGERVTGVTFSLSTVNPVFDIWGDDGEVRSRTEGELSEDGKFVGFSSGLQITYVRDLYTNRKTRAYLSGIAARPGIYTVRTGMRSDEENGWQGPNPPDSFPPAEAEYFIIVSISERWPENKLIIPTKNEIGEASPAMLRIEHIGNAGQVAERAAGAYNYVDGVYSRIDREYLGGIVANYFEYQYEMKSEGTEWLLRGRVLYYPGGDEWVPWTELSRAPTPANWSTYAPNTGWFPKVYLSGAAAFFVRAGATKYGFFEPKGKFNGKPFYQQQELYTPPVAGWTDSRPPESRFGGGLILYYRTDDENEENSAYVLSDSVGGAPLTGPPPELVPIRSAAIPYSPPRRAAIGGDLLGDTALDLQNVHRETAALGAFGSNAGGGLWQYYPLHRQYTPYYGTGSDVFLNAGLSFTIKREIYEKTRSTHWIAIQNGYWEHKEEEIIWHSGYLRISQEDAIKDVDINYSSSGGVGALKCCIRGADISIARLPERTGAGGTLNYNANKTTSIGRSWDLDKNDELIMLSESKIVDENNLVSYSFEGAKTFVDITLGSGSHAGCLHAAVALASGALNGDGSMEYTSRRYIERDGEITSDQSWNMTGSIGLSIAVSSPIPTVQDLSSSLRFSSSGGRSGTESRELSWSSLIPIIEVQKVHPGEWVVDENGPQFNSPWLESMGSYYWHSGSLHATVTWQGRRSYVNGVLTPDSYGTTTVTGSWTDFFYSENGVKGDPPPVHDLSKTINDPDGTAFAIEVAALQQIMANLSEKDPAEVLNPSGASDIFVCELHKERDDLDSEKREMTEWSFG